MKQIKHTKRKKENKSVKHILFCVHSVLSALYDSKVSMYQIFLNVKMLSLAFNWFKFRYKVLKYNAREEQERTLDLVGITISCCFVEAKMTRYSF